jgi:hypothetical protein
MSSLTRWFVLGTFTSGFMVLALPSSGVSHAEPSAPIVLGNQSSGSSATSDTKSSGKEDPLSGGGNTDPSSKMSGQSGQSSGSSHEKEQHTRSGKTGKSDAESSGKMESKDPLSGGGNTDPSSKMEEQSGYR